MQFAWDTIFGALADILKPRRLVEIGAFMGDGTRRILDHCRKHDGHVDVVDPLSPDLDFRRQQEAIFDTLAKENPGRLTFHRAPSLPLLDSLGPYDAILIDGDHNWYTVIEELRSVERMALKHGIVPLIVVDDIGWPHGRRDCYYVPEAIPAQYRQPHRRGGVLVGQSPLVNASAGPFGQFLHAEHEGGPRNGVRTALEDFLRETTLDLVSRLIPLRSGTAVLVPRDDSPEAAPVRNWLDAWAIGETLMPALWQLSAEHISLTNTIGPLYNEVLALRQAVADAPRGPANSP